jgi:hypothetical protein
VVCAALAVPATPSAITAVNSTTFNVFIVFSFCNGKSFSQADEILRRGHFECEGRQPFLNAEDVHLSKNFSTGVPGDGFADCGAGESEGRRIKLHECQRCGPEVCDGGQRKAVPLNEGSFCRTARHRMMIVLAGWTRIVSALTTGIPGGVVAVGAI